MRCYLLFVLTAALTAGMLTIHRSVFLADSDDRVYTGL